ncbi:MAG: hypothetical protein CVT83_05305 [Alphaproteobacteria bacterium HGW-Alphaproteobacteria-5]|nr:MAG: hypothetical protein CVT83_05305 [Alphaproteobacteria bacterium HGW-Alphaproteobacteria-5]
MTELRNDADRDDILFAFHRACARPSAQDVIEWSERFPKLAEDIVAHAAMIRELCARATEEYEEVDPILIARGRSYALSALYNAQAQAPDLETKSAQTFEELFDTASTTLPEVATKIGIKRVILAHMIGGRMLAPVGESLLLPFLHAVNATREQFNAALQLALASPRMGMAKANGEATVTPRSYEDIIRSHYPPEEAAKWLDGA